MIADPFGLPEWSMKVGFFILLAGLVVTLIYSWIYDVHPEGGIVKTEPVKQGKPEGTLSVSQNWKIASYISFVVIAGLIVLNIFGGRKYVKIDESLAKTIAVLPFHNFSGDPDQDYMCEGLTDEIISRLYRVKSFDEVRSLTSVLNYRDTDRNIPEIANELNVNYILEGSYKRMGNDLKITAQLIEPGNDKYIWLQDYELPYSEITGIPGEIALQIANHLRAFLSEDDLQSIDRAATDNLEAFEIMKQAFVLFNRSISTGENNIYEMSRLAEMAIDLDPDYADAHALLSIQYLAKGIFSGSEEMRSVIWDALRHLDKALSLDPGNFAANYFRSLIGVWVEWDYTKMEEFRREFPNAKTFGKYYIPGYAGFDLQMGNFEQALATLGEDILSTSLAINALILLGEDQLARKLLDESIDSLGISPDYAEGFLWLGDFNTALRQLETLLEAGNPMMDIPRFQADLAIALHQTGDKERSQKIIDGMVARSDTTAAGSPAYYVGWYYSWIGDLASAFHWLEKAVENRSPEMPWLKVDPAFNNLKEDPLYWHLYERTGHKAYDDYMASMKE